MQLERSTLAQCSKMSIMVHIDDAHDEDRKTYRGCLIFISSGISFSKEVDLIRSLCDGPINGQVNDS